MPHYLSHGQVPKKRFTAFRKPDGKMYYEHLINSEGFAAESSLLYRINAPSRVARVENMKPLSLAPGGNPIARNFLFKLDKLGKTGDFIESRVPALFSGEDLIFNVSKPTKSMDRFYCNVSSDELILVTKGTGLLQSIFGDIPFEPLDLILVPRGDVIRWQVDSGPHELIVVESRSPIRPPRGFLKSNGQFDDHAEVPRADRCSG
jgi:homogentisate 1,2-dioxygenase